MNKVVLEGHIVVPDKDLPSVKAELPIHLELTRKESGCLVFEVIQDLENENIFRVYEEFKNRASFESHQKRVKESSWGQVTINVERHYQIKDD